MAFIVYGKPTIAIKKDNNAKIRITTVTTTITNMTNEQLDETGFTSKYEVWKHFEDTIPNVRFDDVITIISSGIQT